MENKKLKLGLICSPGGHFFELNSILPSFGDNELFWVTMDSIDTKTVLKDEKVYFAFAPTTRNVINLLKNSFLAIKILIREKPNVIISTGGPVCIPFFYLAKLFAIKTIYVESLTRINTLSLTGKIVYLVSDLFYVQWENLRKKYKKALFSGKILP